MRLTGQIVANNLVQPLSLLSAADGCFLRLILNTHLLAL